MSLLYFHIIKKSLLLVLIVLIHSNLIAQDNKLYQCSDLSNEIKKIKIYNDNLDSLLNNNLNDNYKIRFISKPSFAPEYGFQIFKDTTENHKLQAFLFKENLWNLLYSAKNPDSLKIDIYNKKISDNLVTNIDTLFKILTDSVKIRGTSLPSGFDGITYQFIRKTNEGCICGETWSPENDTPLGELIQICNALMKYAKGDDINIDALNRRIIYLYDKVE